MFRRIRLRKAHTKFLESCRNLEAVRDYWGQASGFRRWFLELISPVPLLGVHEDGKLLLEALQWLEMNCVKVALGEDTIRENHRMVCRPGMEEAGNYRRGAVAVRESKVPRPAAPRIPALMKHLDLKLQDDQRRFEAQNPMDREAVFASAIHVYERIGLIHPFADANGRVARLSMNHLLRRYALGYVILPPLGESRELWEALQEAHKGHFEGLATFARHSLHAI